MSARVHEPVALMPENLRRHDLVHAQRSAVLARVIRQADGMRVRQLELDDLPLVAAIDRSEQIEVQYHVRGGELQQAPAPGTEVPPWDPTGSGPHSVSAKIEFCGSVVARGGMLFGAFDQAQALGLAVVHPFFEPRLAWLAFLHVSRPHRRRGVAKALWDRCVELGVAHGAEHIYVSSAPTESAVGFYLRQGCRLAQPVHAALFAVEPEDIHLVRSIP
jgi:ribosomal protein S18 acetylase RimI-like enzyme